MQRDENLSYLESGCWKTGLYFTTAWMFVSKEFNNKKKTSQGKTREEKGPDRNQSDVRYFKLERL